MSVLEDWDRDGLPPNLFDDSASVRADVQALISALLEHSYEMIDRSGI